MERSEDARITITLAMTARFPIPYHGQHDGHRWMRQWERHIEPRIMRAILHEIRATEGWRATPHAAENGTAEQAGRSIVIAVDHYPADARGDDPDGTGFA